MILTPHMSGANRGYMDKACALFADNLRRFVAGQPLLNVVDRQARLLIRDRGEEAFLQILERPVGHEQRDVAGTRIMQHRGEDRVVRIACDREWTSIGDRIGQFGGVEALICRESDRCP